MASNDKPIRAGIRTTEFWLTLAAQILGVIIALGYADPDGVGMWDKIAGLVIVGLGAFGYTVARSKVKAAEAGK
jgi:hypothetical protein